MRHDKRNRTTGHFTPGEMEMRFTIGRKLALTFGGILVLMLTSTVLSYVKSVQLREQQNFTTTVRVPSLEACRELQRDLNQAGSKARQAILAGTQPQRYAAARTLFDRVWDDIGKDTRRLDEIAPRWIKQENRDRLAEIERQLPEVRKIMEGNIRMAASGERDAVMRAGNEETDKATVLNDAIKRTLGELSVSNQQLLQAESKGLNRATTSLNLTLWITTLIALVLGTIAAILMSRRISNITRSVLDHAEAIASGDLKFSVGTVKQLNHLAVPFQARKRISLTYIRVQPLG